MAEKVIQRKAIEATGIISKYDKEYLRSADVCKIFSISRSTLQWLRDTKQIPFYILGRNTYLYKKEDIEAILVKTTTPNE